MILYQYPGGDGIRSISPPCLRVDLALSRIGRPYDVIDCRGFSEARRASPTGRLPAVRFDDGTVVEDSILILDELERRFPEAGLAPADPEARRHDLLWESFFNDHVYWYGFWMRWVDRECAPRFEQAMFGRLPWIQRQAIHWLLMPIQRRRSRHQGHFGKTPETVHGALVRALDLAHDGLRGGPFLEGRDRPGRGDLGAVSFLVQPAFRGSMPGIEREVLARPGLVRLVHETYRACGMEPTRWMREGAGARAPETAT
jgi:glutathione S-transferase